MIGPDPVVASWSLAPRGSPGRRDRNPRRDSTAKPGEREESLEVPSPGMRSRRHPTSHAIDCSAFSRGGEDKAKIPPNGLLIMVVARRGGRWQFVSFSNTPTRGRNPK
jgi:hypothetical protein